MPITLPQRGCEPAVKLGVSQETIENGAAGNGCNGSYELDGRLNDLAAARAAAAGLAAGRVELRREDFTRVDVLAVLRDAAAAAAAAGQAGQGVAAGGERDEGGGGGARLGDGAEGGPPGRRPGAGRAEARLRGGSEGGGGGEGGAEYVVVAYLLPEAMKRLAPQAARWASISGEAEFYFGRGGLLLRARWAGTRGGGPGSPCFKGEQAGCGG